MYESSIDVLQVEFKFYINFKIIIISPPLSPPSPLPPPPPSPLPPPPPSLSPPPLQTGLTALHLASKQGHVSIVEKLLKRGADVAACTKVL